MGKITGDEPAMAFKYSKKETEYGGVVEQVCY